MIILPNMKSIIGKKINTIAQKIVVGGDFITYNYETMQHIIRLNSDGTLDAGFTATNFDNQINSIILI